MCEKHKKVKTSDRTLPDPEALHLVGERLKQSSQLNGCDGFDASIWVREIPALPTIVPAEKISDLPPFAAPLPSGPQDLKTQQVSDDAASMRKARALCRPLVEYIQKMSGYSFVSILSIH